MEDKPLVSILIPVYNRAILVSTALESALSQTYSNIEIIVVDNASTDNTFEVVQEFSKKDTRVRCYRDHKNIGPVGNWMRCVELSYGEYIKIVFSDDWLAPNAIERYLIPLLERHDIGFSYSSTDIHHEDRVIQGCWKLHKEGLMPSIEYLKGVMIGTVPWSPGCALFRKRDIERWLIRNIPNRFDLNCDSYGMGNDLMPYLKACEEYPYFYYINESLAHFRAHSSSITVAIAKTNPHMGFKCYFSAFGHFLATSILPISQKEELHSLLFLNVLLWTTKRIVENLKPWNLIKDTKQNYKNMFPSNYDILYKFKWSISDSSKFLFRYAVNTIRTIFVKLLQKVRGQL